MHLEIPTPLEQKVEQIYEKAGYTSKTDFVRDATRRRIEELDNL